MLSPYRVIDLTHGAGLMCGQLLADLGADVIQVERPGGSSARQLGPYAGDRADPERSLFWWAYARNKRSIALDFENEADRRELFRLVRGADFLIESEAPGALAKWGLDYPSCAGENPGLIYVSITPFGQTGPKAHWLASDLVSMASGGQTFLTGDPDPPPLRVSVPQAHAHAATDAAVGALIAHFDRLKTGEGQHLDISHQQSVTLATMFRSLDAPLEEAAARRSAGSVWVAGIEIRIRYPLQDGWVILGPAILPSTGHFMTRLMTWFHEEGHCDRSMVEENWHTFVMRLISGELGKQDVDRMDECMATFFAGCSKAKLMSAVIERKLLVAPILGIDEIIEGEQLKARNYPSAASADKDEDRLLYPGPFARFGATPISYRYPPPRIDEHAEAIRAEADRRPLIQLEKGPPGDGPLAGVKVLDLFWILAGPGSTRMLADYGATVVHAESARHLDTLRLIPPYRFNHPHPEGAGGFQSANANKLGITLDFRQPRGREILLELVRWADVVTESFAPGVIDGLDLGYEKLREINPNVIMISSSLMGRTGPWKTFSGFGNLAASVTGFQKMAAWPDHPPCGPYGAYTDFIAVRYNALAILAALEYRRRTGEGQYIDQSQAEAALHFLAPAFLDYTVNGCVPEPMGNRDREIHPQGVYPVAGEDCWIAISICNPTQWRALCEEMKRPDLLDRREESEWVDAEIAIFTASWKGEELEILLQERGIPAHRALNTYELFNCQQLQHREHYLEVACELYQTSCVESSRLKFSRSRARRPEKTLSFGRDNRFVLEELLNYKPEEIAGLAADGILL